MFRMGLAVTAAVWVASVGIAGQTAPSLLTALQSADPAGKSAITGWFCPMHPDVTGEGPSRCTKCGMALIAGDPFDTSDYVLDFRTEPAAIRAGVPFTMFFRIQHPKTGADVQAFELVHDKRFHLFLVSQDMTVFQHIHPELRGDGRWTIEATVPKPGYYTVLSDFVPTGGSPQFLGRSLVTADYDGDLASQAARLEADAVLERTVDTIRAVVQTEPPRFIAGEYGHLAFNLTDAATGQPITDLEPYLGAFGHTLILSEDMTHYVHAHPSEGPDSDITRGLGGPRVTFEGYMPQPGRYRAWTQFQRNGRITTVPLTFTVWSLDEATRMGQRH
jgi:hypothetical protein